MKRDRDVGMGFLAAAVLVASSAALFACGAKKDPLLTDPVATAEPAPELNAWIAVSSEPDVRYRALDVERAGKDRVSIVVERNGPDGMQYSERLVDCEQQVFALAGQWMTQDAFDHRKPTTAVLVPWTAGAADEKIARYACAVAQP